MSYWQEVILGSFRRFMFSRVSQWASAGPLNWSWLPENDLAREEVQTDFSNFAASSRASIWTEGFRGEEWAFKQMRILNVAAADPEPSAGAALAIYDEYLSSTMEFSMLQQLVKRTFRAAEFWDPALAGTPIGEAFGRISVDGPNSFHERYNTLSTSLSVYSDGISVEQKRKEIERCLQAEILGTNIPFNRWQLYYILAEPCRLTGDSKVGRQHQDRCLALEKMIDPYLLRIQKKTMDFWLEYHGTHSWDLLDPPEEEDISDVIERLHQNTKASKLRYSTSDLELQDDIFAEAGALEKAGRHGEVAKLFSELSDKYWFTARSPISILGPRHHIAILLMQQEKYSEAALKLRYLLSKQLNREQEANASIGLAQCLFMQVQEMKDPQDAIYQQLLSEAKKLTATALQLRKHTYPSWHWHYLVPKRLYAQILTTLGSPAHVAECRRTMQEIQASIMTDVQDVNNRQRFAKREPPRQLPAPKSRV